jgi:hypothetical protein
MTPFALGRQMNSQTPLVVVHNSDSYFKQLMRAHPRRVNWLGIFKHLARPLEYCPFSTNTVVLPNGCYASMWRPFCIYKGNKTDQELPQTSVYIVLSTISKLLTLTEHSSLLPTSNMTMMKRLVTAFILIAAALPFVAAQPGHPGPSKCKKNEFWYALSLSILVPAS